MAIEDHPKFAEWVQALDELKQAADAYRVGLNTGDRGALLEPLRLRLGLARARYNRISNEIDGDDEV